MDSQTAYRVLFKEAEQVLRSWTTTTASPQQRESSSWWRAYPHRVIPRQWLPGPTWPTDGMSPALCSLLILWPVIACAIYSGLSDEYAGHHSVPSTIATACLLLLVIVGNLLILRRERRFRSEELTLRLRNVIGRFNFLSQRLEPTPGHYMFSQPIPARSFVYALRDGERIQLPPNLLVAGDVIFLNVGDEAPAKCRRFLPLTQPGTPHIDATPSRRTMTDMILEPGDIYKGDSHVYTKVKRPTPSQPEGVGGCLPGAFVVLRTPLPQLLEAAQNTSQGRSMSHVTQCRIWATTHWQRFAAVMYIVSIVIGVVRIAALAGDSGTWVEMVLLQPSVLLIALLPISLPLLWHGANHYAVARLLAMAYEGHVRIDASDDESMDSWDEESREDETRIHTARSHVWSYFWKVLMNNVTIMSRRSNPVHLLGTISVLGFVDKQGVLALPTPQPDKLFLFTPSAKVDTTRKRQSSAGTDTGMADASDSDTEDMDNSAEDRTSDDEEENPGLELMTAEFLFDERDLFSLQLEGLNWKHYAPQIHAIGLCTLLTSQCSNRLASWQVPAHLCGLSALLTEHRPRPYQYEGCLCRLALGAGFRGHTLLPYRVVNRILTAKSSVEKQALPASEGQAGNLDAALRPRAPSNASATTLQSVEALTESHTPVPSMLSVLVQAAQQGKTGGGAPFQLLSTGTPDMITDHCTKVWDGTAIRELDETNRQAIQETFRTASATMQCVAFSYRPAYRTIPTLDRTSPFMAVHLSPDNCQSQASSSSTQIAGGSRHLSAAKTAHEAQQDQILLGMVALKDAAYRDIVDMVPDLALAGIRFVHFSEDDELESKAFAEELGLETGWNCFISLSSDGRGGEAYLTNKAQLPRGLDHIRPHLENVDDVPLLVPVFSECTSQASAGMVEIMQEYDKVVCAVGSSLKASNMLVFAQADIAIAVDPATDPLCFWPYHKAMHVDGRTDSEADMPRARATLAASTHSFNQRLSVDSAEALSAELTALPCSLRIRRSDDIQMTSILSEARRLKFNLTQAFTFMAWCHLSLVAMLILAQLLFLPPLLGPLHVLWIICVPLPILSMSLMFSKPEQGIMKVFTGKQTGPRYPLRQRIISFSARALPSAVVCVFVFASVLYRGCHLLYGGECHVLLGRRGQPSDTWNRLSKEGYQTLLLAQNVVSWLFVVYCGVLSASCMHRTASFVRYNPLSNSVWIAAFFASIVLQTVFVAVSEETVTAAVRRIGLGDLYTSTYVVAILWIPLIAVLSEAVKVLEARKEQKHQKRAKLEFDTKLGMHSPV